MSHFKPYPAYKDSGVEWIGEVPEHWDVSPFKWHIERNDGGVWGNDPSGTSDTAVLRSTEQTVDGQWIIDQPALRQLSPSEKQSALLEEGDLVVTKSSGSSLHIGKTTLVTSEIAKLECCYSNFMQRLRMKPSFLPRLAWYVMNNGIAREQMDLSSNSTTGLANLNGGMIGQLLLAIPPATEQESLVKELDRETTRIDSLISKKTRFVELLKEKRSALITHAITKGLDPNVQMKDSEVEWLGEIPAHWEVRRMAAIFREAIRPSDPALPILSISIHDGITDNEVAPEDRERRVSQIEDRTKYKRVAPHDLAYNMMRAWQGAFGAVTVDGLVSPAYVVAEPIDAFRTVFIEHLLRTPMAIEEMRRYSRGIADFRMRLYWDYFRDLKVCLPPLDEQDTILSRISRETARIDLLSEKTQHSIALLKERRGALITAAVTGKIDLTAGIQNDR